MTNADVRAPRRARKLALITVTLAASAASMTAVAPANAVVLGSVSATWPASTVRAGAEIYVRGSVTRAQPGSGVVLERAVSGGWALVTKGTINRYRRYRFRIPTWWVGIRAYRVRSTAVTDLTLPVRRFNVLPRYTPSGYATQYRWASRTPTRWNPCAVVGYRVNAAQGGSGALADAKAAFARLRQATGIRFVYRGTTRGIPSYGGNSWYPNDTQVVVAWARRWQSSLFSLYPGAVGVGAALSSSGYYNGNGTRTNRITKGMVVIDSAKRYRGGFGSGKTRGEIVMHELGHAMGLGHHGSRAQLMYPYMTDRAARYGRGDLRGLWARGARLGCVYQSPTGIKGSTMTQLNAMH